MDYISLHEYSGPLIVTKKDGDLRITAPKGYVSHFDFMTLSGRRAGSTTAMLTHFILKLGTASGGDKYASTKGNVGALLHQLRDWAVRFPQGTWHVVRR